LLLCNFVCYIMHTIQLFITFWHTKSMLCVSVMYIWDCMLCVSVMYIWDCMLCQCHVHALWLTQLLTEMNTRNIFWNVKASCAQGWQPCHLHVPIVFKCGSLNLLEPSGPLQACNGIALSFITYSYAVEGSLLQGTVPSFSRRDWGKYESLLSWCWQSNLAIIRYVGFIPA
jgi:hypothetical protein